MSIIDKIMKKINLKKFRYAENRTKIKITRIGTPKYTRVTIQLNLIII